MNSSKQREKLATQRLQRLQEQVGEQNKRNNDQYDLLKVILLATKNTDLKGFRENKKLWEALAKSKG